MRLSLTDFAIIVVYLIGITAFGAHFRKSQHSLKDYFLGGRTTPWWAISLSIVSAETSILTVIGTPGIAYGPLHPLKPGEYAGDLGFLQVVLGYLLARVVIVTVLLPHYFKGDLFTAYQLIERRFGSRLKRLTAIAFLVIRGLAEGVRLFAISILVSVILGTGELTSVVLIAILTLFYTSEGGMKGAVWTSILPLAMYLGGAIATIAMLPNLVPGGWNEITALAAAAGHKFNVFDFSFDVTRNYTFWAGIIGGLFLTTATHGTDQMMVQRLLAARNEKQSRLALLGSWVVVFFQFAMFLVIGVMLFAYYHHFPPAAAFSRPDAIYPTFIVEKFPKVLAGLLLAAILASGMTNLGAALNALASTSIVDLYRAHIVRGRSETHYLRASRVATLLWGAILIGVALASSHWQKSVFEMGLSIASVAFGCLLGVFLLGVLTKLANENGAIIGMVVGLAVMIYVWKWTPIAWTWYVGIGTAVTFSVGYATSLIWAGSTKTVYE